jgi:hypothetical protein
MEEVALDEEGAEISGCRGHGVGAAVGQSHGEIARFAHGANYIGVGQVERVQSDNVDAFRSGRRATRHLRGSAR